MIVVNSNSACRVVEGHSPDRRRAAEYAAGVLQAHSTLDHGRTRVQTTGKSILTCFPADSWLAGSWFWRMVRLKRCCSLTGGGLRMHGWYQGSCKWRRTHIYSLKGSDGVAFQRVRIEGSVDIVNTTSGLRAHAVTRATGAQAVAHTYCIWRVVEGPHSELRQNGGLANALRPYLWNNLC